MFSAKSLRHLGGDTVAQAWGDIEQALLLPGGRLELLVCEYARPHSDTSYAGKGFVSTVLHTGPQPYVVDVFTTSRAVEGGLEVNARTRMLSAGDTFVLDPKIPHSAMPVRPQAGCLLVLAQQEVPLACRADYEALLRLLPREASDRDITMLDWT